MIDLKNKKEYILNNIVLREKEFYIEANFYTKKKDSIQLHTGIDRLLLTMKFMMEQVIM